jgi:1-acyl-sn-glycerol-3-phosphate acyltransferase
MYMKIFLQRVYFLLWGLPVFSVCMVVFTLLILISLGFLPNRKLGGRVAYFWLRCWGYSFSTLTGVFYSTYISPKVAKKGTYVYTGNHNSFIDGITICLSIPHDFRPLGKVELMKVPVFGWMYRYVVILVDRKSVESRLQSMKEMERHLKEGISILVFPEGTMNLSNQPLQEFKNGAFTLAIDTQTPIVPMVMINTKKVLPRKPKMAFRPGWVKTYLLDPIETKGLTRGDVESLKEKVRTVMEAKLLEFA